VSVLVKTLMMSRFPCAGRLGADLWCLLASAREGVQARCLVNLCPLPR